MASFLASFRRKEGEISVGDLSNSELEETSHPECDGSAPKLHVMVAGLPRSGKSTGLNNIFGLDLPARMSATPVTIKVVSTKTKKNGISLTVIDVPGLASASITEDSIVLRDMKNIGAKNTFLLILTLSVSQSSSITDGYKQILKNLTIIFGSKIWDWCLVLLTFSDKVRESDFSRDEDEQNYLDHLKDHCTVLQEVLTDLGIKKPVKLFFEYITFSQFKDENVDAIVAIPAGKMPDIPTNRLFPLQPWTLNYQWTDLAMMTVSKLNKNIPDANRLRSAIIQLRYGYFTTKDRRRAIAMATVVGAAGGGALGGGAGAGAGGLFGFSVGPVGSVIGAVVGGVIGVIAGGITGAISIASGAIAITMINNKLEMQRREKTR